MTTTLPVIDADAHVIETERTWDYLEPLEQKYRPQLFYSKDDGNQQYWVIDGKIRGFRFPTLNEQQLRELSQKTGRNLETPQAARELDDVELRLQHMDRLGIDIQVLHANVGVFARHAGHRIAPQLGNLEHVGLVHRRDEPAPAARRGECDAGHPLHLDGGIRHGVHRPRRRPSTRLPVVQSAQQLAHDEDADAPQPLCFERRPASERGMDRHRPQIREHPEQRP